jgi:hypothetical protein
MSKQILWLDSWEWHFATHEHIILFLNAFKHTLKCLIISRCFQILCDEERKFKESVATHGHSTSLLLYWSWGWCHFDVKHCGNPNRWSPKKRPSNIVPTSLEIMFPCCLWKIETYLLCIDHFHINAHRKNQNLISFPCLLTHASPKRKKGR